MHIGCYTGSSPHLPNSQNNLHICRECIPRLPSGLTPHCPHLMGSATVRPIPQPQSTVSTLDEESIYPHLHDDILLHYPLTTGSTSAATTTPPRHLHVPINSDCRHNTPHPLLLGDSPQHYPLLTSCCEPCVADRSLLESTC